MCQFLLGTVQHTVNEIDKIVNVVLENVSIPLRYGTTSMLTGKQPLVYNRMWCQFLLGTVQLLCKDAE